MQKNEFLHFARIYPFVLWNTAACISVTFYAISAKKALLFCLASLTMQSRPIAFLPRSFFYRDESEALLTHTGWQCDHWNSLNLSVWAWLSFSLVISLNACQFGLVSHFIEFDRSFHPKNISRSNQKALWIGLDWKYFSGTERSFCSIFKKLSIVHYGIVKSLLNFGSYQHVQSKVKIINLKKHKTSSIRASLLVLKKLP